MSSLPLFYYSAVRKRFDTGTTAMHVLDVSLLQGVKNKLLIHFTSKSLSLKPSSDSQRCWIAVLCAQHTVLDSWLRMQSPCHTQIIYDGSSR